MDRLKNIRSSLINPTLSGLDVWLGNPLVESSKTIQGYKTGLENLFIDVS